MPFSIPRFLDGVDGWRTVRAGIAVKTMGGDEGGLMVKVMAMVKKMKQLKLQLIHMLAPHP